MFEAPLPLHKRNDRGARTSHLYPSAGMNTDEMGQIESGILRSSIRHSHAAEHEGFLRLIIGKPKILTFSLIKLWQIFRRHKADISQQELCPCCRIPQEERRTFRHESGKQKAAGPAKSLHTFGKNHFIFHKANVAQKYQPDKQDYLLFSCP